MKTSTRSDHSDRRLFPLQQKHRMAQRRTLEILKRRLLGDIEKATEGIAVLDQLLQKEASLTGRQLQYGHGLRTSPARENCLASRPQVAHPVHYPIGSGQVALAILLNHRDGRGTRLPAFTPAHGQQMDQANLETRAHQSRFENISKTNKTLSFPCSFHTLYPLPSSFRQSFLCRLCQLIFHDQCYFINRRFITGISAIKNETPEMTEHPHAQPCARLRHLVARQFAHAALYSWPPRLASTMAAP